jgi:hypothetical protein
LILDGTAAALIALGSAMPKDALGALIAVGSATYLLGGPIVHAARGNWGRSAGSLLLRAGTPLAGAVLGASFCVPDSGDCIEGVLALATIGMLTAAALDLSLLHWEPLPAPKPTASGTITPQLTFDRQSLTLGAATTF